MTPPARRIIVGITGASGAIFGVRLLALLRTAGIETHLVWSRSAEMTLAAELGMKPPALAALASRHYGALDVAAPISSGSFQTDGMIIAPCSIRTLSEIATGATSTLLSRAADVVLKERRRLVLMVRETPLHEGHLDTMARATRLGAIIAPPMPAFYARPQTIDDLVDHTLGRVLDLFGIDSGTVRRWGERET